MAVTPRIDPVRLEEFMGRFVHDFGAGATAPLVVLGDKLGLYKAMADGAPVTPAQLAQRTEQQRALHPRVALPSRRRAATSTTTPARARSGCRPSRRLRSPTTQPRVHRRRLPGAGGHGQGRAAHRRARSARVTDSLGTSTTTTCSKAPSASSAPATWRTSSTPWLPALDGVADKLEAGARVADIGCGHGASTILMAEAYPRSTFVGSDYHEARSSARASAAETPAWPTA